MIKVVKPKFENLLFHPFFYHVLIKNNLILYFIKRIFILKLTCRYLK